MKRDAFTPIGKAFESAFGGAYAGRRVLVTGHTGFKGSWLTLWLRQLGAEVFGLALPPPSGPSHCRLLGLPVDEALIDIRDAGSVQRAMQRFAPEIVFHLAAQPLVRRSYREPTTTWATNVMGLVNVLEAVRATPSVRALVNVTSDKCYAQRHSLAPFRESDALGGHDPYSASKACAEIVSASYRASFFDQDDGRGHRVALATARAGNVIGGGDWGEDRLVPDLVRGAIARSVTPIRNPQATRPWQHVLEPLAGYLLIGQNLIDEPQWAGQAWNFGPEPAGHVSVGELVTCLASHWPAMRCELNQAPQPHEADWLALDCSKAQGELDWYPVWNIDTTLERTAHWYRHLHLTGELRSQADLLRYTADAAAMGLPWAPAHADVGALALDAA